MGACHESIVNRVLRGADTHGPQSRTRPWISEVCQNIDSSLANFQRRALRTLGMRDERIVSIAELSGSHRNPVKYLGEISPASVNEWTDRRSRLTQQISHNQVRMFEVKEGIVDLRYGAVFLLTGELIAESTVWDPLRFLLSNPRPPAERSDAFLDNFSIVPASSFYHFMLEDLPRLAWVKQAFPRRGLVMGQHSGLFARESAHLLSEEVRHTRSRFLRVRDYPFVAFDSPSGWPSRTTVDFVASLTRQWWSPSDSPPELKVYVSRLGHSRSPVNEDKVVELAKSYGYFCVDTATLTLEDQAQLFDRASIVAGVHGAGLTNILWMRRGGKVIEVMDPSYYNPCYQWLSEVRGLSHQTLVNSEESPRQVDLDALAAEMSSASESGL